MSVRHAYNRGPIMDAAGNEVRGITSVENQNYNQYDRTYDPGLKKEMGIENMLVAVNDGTRNVTVSPFDMSEGLLNLMNSPYLTDREKADHFNISSALVNGVSELQTLNAALEAKDPTFDITNYADDETAQDLNRFVDAVRENKRRVSFRDFNNKTGIESLVETLGAFRRLLGATENNRGYNTDTIFNNTKALYERLGMNPNDPEVLRDINVITGLFGHGNFNPVEFVMAMARNTLVAEGMTQCNLRGRDVNKATAELDYALYSLSSTLTNVANREENRGNYELLNTLDDIENQVITELMNIQSIHPDQYDYYRRCKFRSPLGDTRGGIFNEEMRKYREMGFHNFPDLPMPGQQTPNNQNFSTMIINPNGQGALPGNTFNFNNYANEYKQGLMSRTLPEINNNSQMIPHTSSWKLPNGTDLSSTLSLVKSGQPSWLNNNSNNNNGGNNNMNNFNNGNNYNNGYGYNQNNQGGFGINNNGYNYNTPMMNQPQYPQNNFATNPGFQPMGQQSQQGFNMNINNPNATPQYPMNNQMNTGWTPRFTNPQNNMNNGYNNVPTFNNNTYNQQQPMNPVANAFSDFRNNYAKTGDPNTAPVWTAVNPAVQQHASPNPINFDNNAPNGVTFYDNRGVMYGYSNGQLFRWFNNRAIPVVDYPNGTLYYEHFEGDKIINGNVIIADASPAGSNANVNGVQNVGGSSNGSSLSGHAILV